MSSLFGSSERLAFVLSLNADGAIRGFQQVGRTAETELGKADAKLDKIGNRMVGAGVGALAFAGVAGAALASFARASEEANLSQVRLQNSIENSPELAGESADRFTDLAAAIQSVTAADADQIVAAEAMLGTFHLTGDEIERVTPLVVDYARKFGMDLTTAATQVGKALAGNIGTLQRNGIMIDQAAYATDRFSAVTAALRENVGGFAEAEGRTFAGQLERLKNQLGDIEEGVGVGVVQAFQSLLGPVSSVSQRFAAMSPQTQAAIGKFAAFGTATVGVVGGLSAVVGQAIKLRDRFMPMNDAVEGGGRQLTKMGTAVAGLGLAGAALAVYEFGRSLNGASVDVAKFAAATEDGLGASLEKLGPLFEKQSYLGDQIAEQMLSQNVPAVERLADQMDAAGYSTDYLREKIAQQRREDVQAAADADAYSSSVAGQAEASTRAGDATGQLEKNERKAREEAKKLADAHRDAAQRAEEFRQAIADLTDQIGDSYDRMVATSDLVATYEAAIDGLTGSIQENSSTLDLQTEAGRSNYDQARQTADAIVHLMQRRYEETGSLLAAIQAGDSYVGNLRDQLRAAGLTESQVNDYINTLHLVPADIATNLTLNSKQAVEALQAYQRMLAGVTENSYEVDLFSRKPGARASGGTVSSNEPYLVGEAGPELFVPNRTGTIVPNDKLAAGGGVVVYQNFYGHTDRQMVDDANAKLTWDLRNRGVA